MTLDTKRTATAGTVTVAGSEQDGKDGPIIAETAAPVNRGRPNRQNRCAICGARDDLKPSRYAGIYVCRNSLACVQVLYDSAEPVPVDRVLPGVAW